MLRAILYSMGNSKKENKNSFQDRVKLLLKQKVELFLREKLDFFIIFYLRVYKIYIVIKNEFISPPF
jgi:hypothetical protein